jgi:hypothetical protein
MVSGFFEDHGEVRRDWCGRKWPGKLVGCGIRIATNINQLFLWGKNTFWTIVATFCKHSTLWQRSLNRRTRTKIDLTWSDCRYVGYEEKLFSGENIPPSTVVRTNHCDHFGNFSARRDSCKQSNRNQWNSPCRWGRQDRKAIEMANSGWGKWW